MNANASVSGSPTIAASVDGSKVGEPISKYIYGQFIEHLGNLINNGLWAEMLDDRKFFSPVSSEEESEPPPRPRRRIRKWRPVGPDEYVVMDEERPYVGDYSPLIKLDGTTAHGIQQSGVGLRKSKAYTGRVILAGEAGTEVEISLVWGPDPGDRQSISIDGLQYEYAKFPLEFTAGADTQDGWLEIVGSGEGAFRVGAVSLMPADNIQGFRPDTIKLLKQLNSAIYRFPGGNFVSNHDWRDAIGDPDKRPPRLDHAWSVMQPNDVGTDEFMILCELLDVEPYITVNAGFGEARSAADLVEYTNGSVDTPMGKLRVVNGHPKPYNIKWWGIGNEMYGYWQLGYMSLEHFVIKHNMFAKAMREVDPTVKLIASGAMPDEITVTTISRRITGKVLTEYGSEADWSFGMLTNCLDYMDILSEHFYAFDGERFDLEAGQTCALDDPQAANVEVEEPLVDWARRPANYVRCKIEHYEEYLKRIPGLRAKRIPLNIDEWAYARIRPSLRVALSYAWVLHEMFRHTDIIKMAAYTFATSCIDWAGTDAAFNTTGLLFKLYRDHFGTLPVEATGNSPQPAPRFPVGGDQPQTNAGSDTYPLDVAAALTSDRKALTVAIVNPTESVQALAIHFEGIEFRANGRMWQMTGRDADACNEVGKEPMVGIVETPVEDVPGKLTVAPISINLYEFEIK